MRFLLLRFLYSRGGAGSRPSRIVRKLCASVTDLCDDDVYVVSVFPEPEVDVFLVCRNEEVVSSLERAISGFKVPVEVVELYPSPFREEGLLRSKDGLAKDPHRALEAGKSFSHMGMLDEARERLEEAVAGNPGCLEAYYYLIAVLRKRGLADEARKVVLQGLAYHKDSAELYFVLAELLEESGDLEGALFYLKRAIALEPSMAAFFSKMGELLHRLGQPDAARLAYEEALAKDPELIEPAVGIGFLLVEEGKFAEALDWLMRGIALENNEEVLLKIGWCRLHLGDLEAARSCFAKVLYKGRAGYEVSARFSLARVYLEKRLYGEAEQELNFVLEQQPDMIEARHMLARCYAARGEHRLALEEWRKVIAGDGEQLPRVAPHMALCLSRDGRYKEAQDLVLEALSQEVSSGLLELLASIYAAQGNWPLAAEVLSDAQSLDPESAMIYFHQGWVWENMGRIDKAKDLYRKALRLNPDFTEAYKALGWLYYEQGDIEVALVLFEKGYELAPSDPEILDGLGWVYLIKEEYARALTYFESAIQKGEDCKLYRGHRAAALCHLGRVGEARQELESLLDGRPDEELEDFCRSLLLMLGDLQQEGTNTAVTGNKAGFLRYGKHRRTKQAPWSRLRRVKKGVASRWGTFPIATGE